MSFLMHVVAQVPPYVIFETILHIHSFLSARLSEFRLFHPCRSLHRKLWYKSWTRKSDIIRPRYELINACGGSCPSVLYLWHYITFSFTPLNSSFGIWIFSSYVVAYIVNFDTRYETRKSDMIRPHYDLFNAWGGSSPSLTYLWHYITFSFIPLRSSFGIWIFSSHVVAYIISFDSRSLTRRSIIILPRYELFTACGGSSPSLPYL